MLSTSCSSGGGEPTFAGDPNPPPPARPSDSGSVLSFSPTLSHNTIAPVSSSLLAAAAADCAPSALQPATKSARHSDNGAASAGGRANVHTYVHAGRDAEPSLSDIPIATLASTEPHSSPFHAIEPVDVPGLRALKVKGRLLGQYLFDEGLQGEEGKGVCSAPASPCSATLSSLASRGSGGISRRGSNGRVLLHVSSSDSDIASHFSFKVG